MERMARAERRTVRVLLVDDQAAIRRGMRMRLALEPDLEIIAESDNGAGAVELCRTLTPDIVLMDVVMPEVDGIAATSAVALLPARPAVIIVSLYDDPETRRRAKEAGAAAFLSKHEVDRLLLPTIRGVMEQRG
jgi:DNA-binding NarL/FixJ family response regulator